MEKKNVLKEKSFNFSISIVKLVQQLQDESKEYVLSKQLLRSGTAIGALICEAEFGQSTADFLSKMYISLKEANETKYWLELLFATNYITAEKYEQSYTDCKELVAMLVATTKTIKSKNTKTNNF